MPSLLRARIYCFYCGTKSPHRKGDKVDRFQCSACEGTNFLDEHGEITDVPIEALQTPTQTGKRYTNIQQSSLSPQGQQDHAADSLFCEQCLKNQRFLADLLANYLPSENDPRYGEFEAAYPAYKTKLEKRYPPVCPQCEPRVRDRLKKSSYAAKSDILSKSLLKNTIPASFSDQRFSRQTLLRGFLVLSEFVWWVSSLIQASWHLYGARQTLQYPAIILGHKPSTLLYTLAPCLRRSFDTEPLHPVCNAEFWVAIRYTLGTSLAMLWWNPALLRLSHTRTIHKTTFYGLQIAVLAVRFIAWSTLGHTHHTWDRQTPKAAHAFALAVIVMNHVLSYRIISAAPKPKVEFRSLDAPLIDPDSVHYPQSNFTSGSKPVSATNRGFSIKNLAARSDFSPESESTSTDSSSAQPASTLDFRVRPPVNDEDSMDWEPSTNQSGYGLRPRSNVPSVNTVSFGQLQTQPLPSPRTPAAPSPFYGTLPPAPKSLEAKIRTAAQRQPAQFKPAPDTKQADWFKRMGLAQSKSSWVNKEYVRTVDEPDRRKLELAEGKLSLSALGLGNDGGTGLEDIFGSNFRLNDDSPVKETRDPMEPVARHLGPIEISAVALPATLALWMAFTYLAPNQAGVVSSWVQGLAEWGREKAYGR
ncbi:hypothetical protein CAC42_6670 [Sphaceloma murrayae]|uniref:Ima1 N-terminal domain-containing protein n=1 Tax=Sphaceloma murrayae TaxID=2082308 RepID=A0A2K1QG51_9PEZI|nr:hypothetical protein CAC42_6670 [Sphaceloma murrayae]